jgi:hypothetical protein
MGVDFHECVCCGIPFKMFLDVLEHEKFTYKYQQKQSLKTLLHEDRHRALDYIKDVLRGTTEHHKHSKFVTNKEQIPVKQCSIDYIASHIWTWFLDVANKNKTEVAMDMFHAWEQFADGL